MPCRDKVTVGTKLNIEEAQRLKEEALEMGMSLNELVKERLLCGVRKSETEVEIESLCDLTNIKVESFYGQIREMFLDGRLLVEGGVVETSEGEVLTKFKEACLEKGKDFEETLVKFTQMVWNERTGGGAGA